MCSRRPTGAPFLVTLAAKRRQGLLPASELFLPGLLAQARDNYWRYPVYRPIFGLAGVGLPYAALARSRWLLPIGWSGLYIVAYTALGVTSYFWYYGPVLVGFVALAGLGAEWLARLVQRVLGAGGRLAAGTAAGRTAATRRVCGPALARSPRYAPAAVPCRRHVAARAHPARRTRRHA
ncbi:MAG: hypothetical protein U0Z44_12810 [Kouleothrix sp.]